MFVYIYDGSFEGLLTSVYEAYYTQEKPEKILKNIEFEPSLIYKPIYIHTDLDKFHKVYDAINTKIGNEALQNIYYTFLSELKDSSTLIYKYIKLGFKIGRDLPEYLHLDTVLKIQDISKKVTCEAHRMLGFIRFTDLHNNIYYAPIEPDHNLLTLVSPHFANRLATERWIIHDLKRDLASLYDNGQWIITTFKKDKYLEFNIRDKQEEYENLWKEYFKSAAIEDRLNPKAQRRSMPIRYHKHLTEFME